MSEKCEEIKEVFVFKENTESKLYRDFLTKWEKTWSATECGDNDEAEEELDEERYFEEKRRSSKQMYRKSKQYIALNVF